MPAHRKISLLIIITGFGIGVAFMLNEWGNRLAARGAGELRPLSGATPKRMVVLSVAAVEIIFALGEGQRIVGATRFADYPDAAKRIPKLGGVMDINFEALTAAAPDLIIAQSRSERLKGFAKRRRIPFRRLNIERIDDVYRTVAELGALLGREAAAAALVGSLKQSLRAIAARTADLAPVPCFISVDRTPGEMAQLLSPGADTFISELVRIAGGRNVFDDVETGYPTVSKESLLSRAPEVILEMKPGETGRAATRALAADWHLLGSIPAVANGRIAVIPHRAGLLPSLRMAEVASAMARVLHPEAFPPPKTANRTEGEK